MNSVYDYHKKHNVLFADNDITCKFDGIVDKTYDFVTKSQLCDRALWTRFVNQFRYHEDSNDNGWRGEYWGKMMRGACFVYSYTHDDELYKILEETVIDMLSVADDDGRISSYTREKEFIGWDMWCRKYVLLGLQYFLEICNDKSLSKRIVDTMCGCLDYVLQYVGEDKIGICHTSSHGWRGLNAASILEPVVRLYMITGKTEYIDFAKHIVDAGGTDIANLIDIAYEDKTDPYQYPITKAYEMISFFEGVLEYYRATGDEKYKTACVNFARRLAEAETTVIGGVGSTEELFDHAAVRQADKPLHNVMQETCVTVTWMKFCMQILMITGDMRFADYYERAFYNAYLGAVNFDGNIQTGLKSQLKKYPDAIIEKLPFDSYSPLRADVRGKAVGGLKVMRDNHLYGCCVAIGSAGIGTFHKVAVMKSKFGIAINLYANGKVSATTPSGEKVDFTIKTGYPTSSRVDIILDLAKEEKFELKLAIPEWSKNTKLYINGDCVDVKPYEVIVDRLWKSGDIVSLELDMTPIVHRPISCPVDFVLVDYKGKENYLVGRVVTEAPDKMHHVAITRGPIVLAYDERLNKKLGEQMHFKTDQYDSISLEPSQSADFNTLCEFETVLEGKYKKIKLIDYASAGSDFSKKIAVWMPVKNYDI